jgi:hypothetical protein
MYNPISPLVQPFLIVMAFMLLCAISLDAPPDQIVLLSVFTILYTLFVSLVHAWCRKIRKDRDGRPPRPW